MKKEVFFAVFIGFALGLVITFGIWTANKTLKKPDNGLGAISDSTSASPSPAPVTTTSPAPTSTIPLTISSPEYESISSESSITLTGKTAPLIPIAITYESSETITLSDSAGTFSQVIKLEGGYNRITITAFDKNGNSKSTDLIVTYTTSKI